jgi:hypothetical protein
MKGISLLSVIGILILQPTNVFSLIRECSSIQEVIADAQPGTLVIFDIDNTLLHPCQMLGSDEWFQYYVKKKERQLHNYEEALNQAVDILHSVYCSTRVKPMEACTVEVVHALQNQGLNVIGLTSRSSTVAGVTIRQLASIGIDLSVTAPSQASFSFAGLSETLYFHGVVFTKGKSKKNALSAFFEQLSWCPKRILFIDDGKKHIDELSTYENEGFEFVGLRLNVADAYVKALDPKICDAELEEFLDRMPDTRTFEYIQSQEFTYYSPRAGDAN